MTKIEALIPELRQLTRREKWEVLEFLMRELAAEEPPLLQPHQEYPIWSPQDAFSAGQALLKALEEEKARD